MYGEYRTRSATVKLRKSGAQHSTAINYPTAKNKLLLGIKEMTIIILPEAVVN